ncbi:hypothetical protein DSM117340_02211 [Lentibacter algarum]
MQKIITPLQIADYKSNWFPGHSVQVDMDGVRIFVKRILNNTRGLFLNILSQTIVIHSISKTSLLQKNLLLNIINGILAFIPLMNLCIQTKSYRSRLRFLNTKLLIFLL